ncbi:MAG TPA: VCBS repeat-containing protein [Vicinamibacterales bacterium]|nr:VCBS repeat-containing protein [Vicinamibacterales bacterium]
MRQLIARTVFAAACCLAYVCAPTSAYAAQLPRQLASLPGADDGRFVSVITVDIDADGDLDVIASDHALQLHVWVNDGDGHFTRREPTTRSTTWQPLPLAPGLDDHPVSSQVFTPVNPQSLDVDRRHTMFVVPATATLHSTTVGLVAIQTQSTRSPRAPPLA